MKGESQLYEELAQLAYNTVLGTMYEGAEKHGADGWQKVSIQEHIQHALAHIEKIGQNDENHLEHAITRLVLVKALVDK